MNVKQFENKRWRKDDQVICFRHKMALDMINTGTVLDLGSGDGLFLSLLKQKGIAGEGLDVSEDGVLKTQKKGLEASVANFTDKIPFKDNAFDTVVMLDLMEHLYTPEALLKEAVRVSKKSIIIGVPNFNSLPARIQVLLGRVPENNRPGKGHVHWFNYGILVSMLSGCNLVVVQIETNTFFQRMPVIGLITRSLAFVFPGLFGLSFVVKAEKV